MRLFERFDPEAVALRDGRRAIKAGEAERRVFALHHHLKENLGLAPGETIALHLGNRVEIFELLLAGVAAGLNVVPLGRHLRPAELRYIVGDSEARFIIHDEESQGAFDGDPRALALEDLYRDRFYASAEDLGEAPRWERDAPPGGPTIYTSGTSGKPKGVVRARPRRFIDAIEGFRRAGALFGLDGSGPHLVAGPLYHAAPLLFALYDLLNGAPIIVLDRFDERALLETITRERVAHLHLVPTHFIRLLRLPEEERRAFDPSSITLTLHGAAPIAPSTKRAMLAWWGGELREYWGATEGGIYTLIDRSEWLLREGSVGRPLPHFEIAAFDEEGARLGPGEIGTLYIRHRHEPEPFIYRGDPEKTREAYLEGGFFTAGDLGHVDADGYVYLSARRSNLILSGGVNIYPAEIEAAALGDEDIQGMLEEIIVYGEPDEEWGERVVAAISLRPGHDASVIPLIRVRLAERIAGYKLPRIFELYASLPRNEAGKIRLADLEHAERLGRYEL